jgi:tetratricopeptide (TPR) repeat protein
MDLDLDSRIERYGNRELHPAAVRALAHEALEDPDLFEELTAVGLARAAMDSPATTDRALAQAALDDEDLFETLVARGAIESSLKEPAFHAILHIGHRRKHWAIALVGVGAAAAVAAGLLAFFFLRPTPSLKPIEQPAIEARTVPPKPKPTVAPGVLLTSDLRPTRSRNNPIFRGGDTTSRAPKSDGAIVALDDGDATVNLGSIDGLAKGTELAVFRDKDRDKQIGRIVITTVFRDSARALIVDGKTIQAGDQARVPNAAHVNAILQLVDALAASGYRKEARDLAQKTIGGGTPGETRRLLERLAALDYQAGAADAAREHYEVAVNNFDQPPPASPTERAATLASFGALSVSSGDPQRTEEVLQKALAQTTDLGLRAQIFNNLGAVAELRGDPTKAAEYYNQALSPRTRKITKRQRAIVQANLARVKSTKRP